MLSEKQLNLMQQKSALRHSCKFKKLPVPKKAKKKPKIKQKHKPVKVFTPVPKLTKWQLFEQKAIIIKSIAAKIDSF